ncbi:GNAT family N-acetyltransferase [Veronia nyctiphanis]|uniref:GNAT family N-acetyltransferase n=1 Tax=Veronia nyctiphanis TaxID=1278244 RepID=A0A4Q0YSE0_9GAMM|nr:GNAT family N-acetyltransferase [Veronia nyctiphanis]RXJ74157.1 GNAT family N-acetyltransferase [Veronia nyctiphanis]
MNVREIEIADIADIFSLMQAKAKFDGRPESLKLDENKIEEVFFSNSPKAKAIVATIDGKVIGIATYYDIFSTFIAKPGLWLDDLYIDESHRKSGAGKALVTKLCQIAKSNGCARIDWIVADNNKNGKGFYNALGATIFDGIRHSRLDESAIHQLAESV